MGRRNYCMADYDNATGEVQFTICVEKSQGSGTTKECVQPCSGPLLLVADMHCDPAVAGILSALRPRAGDQFLLEAGALLHLYLVPLITSCKGNAFRTDSHYEFHVPNHAQARMSSPSSQKSDSPRATLSSSVHSRTSGTA